MSNFSFRQFLEFAMKQATRIFNRTGQLCPMYHAVSSAGEDYVFPALPGDKDVSTAAARAFLVSIEATRVAFIDEAWMMAPKEGVSRDDLARYNAQGLSKQPGRIEVILICAEDEREGMLMATREIIRSGTDVHLGALRILQADGMEDRMIGLLPRKGTVQ
jgi:hypothetical protein